MLIVFLFFLWSFFVCMGSGLVVFRIFNQKSLSFIWLLWSGLMTHLLMAHFFVFWMPLNTNYAIGVSIMSFLGLLLEHQKAQLYVSSFYCLWKSQSKSKRFSFIIWMVLITALCAHPPFLIDNESYYIATIKWVSEFGLVKGLANFHVFLAQTSGWHLLQAGFGFSLFNSTFYDLNGLVSIFFVFHLMFFSPFKNAFFQIVLLLSSLLMLPFVSSPSPDLILFVLTPLIIFTYFKSVSEKEKLGLAFLGISLFLVKPTAFFLLLFFLWDTKKRKTFVYVLMFSVFVLILWMAKNTILSGWICYPLPWFSIDFNWKLPEVYFDFQNTNRIDATVTSLNPFRGFSIMTMSIHFIYFFNCLLLGFFYYRNNQFTYVKLLVLIVIQWLVVMGMGGNFRFLFPCVLVLSVLTLFCFKTIFRGFYARFSWSEKSIFFQAFLFIVVSFPWLFWCFFTPLKIYTQQKIAYHEWSEFESGYLVSPAAASRFPQTEFELKTMGNLKYYSPTSKSGFPRFLFGTYQGTIPTVNEQQLLYFEKRFGLVPQLRTGHLEDGFQSVLFRKVEKREKQKSE